MTSMVIGAAEIAVGFMTESPTLMVMGAATLAMGLLAPKNRAPQQNDLRLQVSQYGWCIPRYFGTDRGDGNVIWQADPVRHESSDGGKGGPSAPPTVTWTCSYAILLGAAIDGVTTAIDDVTHIWEDGRLVYDGNNDDDYPFTLYLGTEDQMPDPTMESYLGAGNVGANRGNAYIVYTDKELSSSGNRIPQTSFRITRGGAHTDKPIVVALKNNNTSPPHHDFGTTGNVFFTAGSPAIMSWPLAGPDPVRVLGIEGGNATYTYNADTLAYVGSEAPITGETFPSDIGFEGDVIYVGIGTYKYANGDTVSLWGAMRFRVDGTSYTGPTYSTGYAVASGAPPNCSTPPTITGSANFLSLAGLTSTDRVKWCTPSQDGKCLIVHVTTAAQAAIDASLADKWYRVINGVVHSSGAIVGAQTFEPNPGPIARGPYPQGAMLENNYRYLWFVLGNISTVEVFWINDSNVFEKAAVHIPPYAGGQLPLTGDHAGDGGFPWSNRLAVFALPGGCRCGIVQGYSAYLVERCDLATGVMRLDEVVSELSLSTKRLVPAQFNVTQLHDDIVDGYKIAVQSTTRAAIQQLMATYFFEGVEVDCRIVFVKLGRQSVVSIDDDDLGAFPSASQPIAQIIRARPNETPLPRMSYLTYTDASMDYQENTVPSQRMTGNAAAETTITLPIVMDNNKARQVADVQLLAPHYERNGGQISLPPKYGYLVPTDVITVLGDVLRLKDEHDARNTLILTFDAVPSSSSLWGQGALGGTSLGFKPQEIPSRQETECVILDAPFPIEGREGVVYAAMAGMTRREWRGAQLFKSTDNGLTWHAVASSSAPSTIAHALTVLPDFHSGNVIDLLSPRMQILVHPGGGTLASVTRDEAELGANLVMWGTEALSFLDADVISSDDDGTVYEVGRYLRGLHGAEHMMGGHTIGDVIVLMSTAVPVDAAFSDYGRTELYKAVTFGSSLASAPIITFRSNGVSRAPWAPVHLGVGISGLDMSGHTDYRMQWVPRMRLHNAWLDLVDLPQDETIEKYRVRIWTDDTYTDPPVNEYFVTFGIDFFVPNAPFFLYIYAKQSADFSSPLVAPPAWSVAKVGALGPGYEAPTGRLPLFVAQGAAPGWDGSLGGYTNVIRVSIDWNRPGSYTNLGMNQGDIIVAEFTTGNIGTTGSLLPSIRGAEWLGPPTSRTASLSTAPGDFSGSALVLESGSTSIFFPFAIEPASSPPGGVPILARNTKYYVNVKNDPLSCPGGCTMFVELTKPGSL